MNGIGTGPRLGNWLNRRTGNLLGLLACAGLMGYALFAQYVLHLDPCPLCILQRVAVMAVGAFFLLAALHDPARFGARLYGALIVLCAALGVMVAARQLWIIAQPPGTVAECGASLEYMMDVLPWREVLDKVLRGSGECAKVDWHFLGLNMPTWVLIALILLAVWGVLVNWRFLKRGA